MKLVHETEPGKFEQFSGGTLTRLETQAVRKTNWHDGRTETETIDVDPYPMEVKVSLKAARAWSDEERTAHSLFVVEPAVAPDGHRFVKGSQATYSRPVKNGPVIEARETELRPTVPVRTAEQKFNALAQEFDLSPSELAEQIKKATPRVVAK